MKSKDIMKLKDMVRNVLEKDPESRNSDTYLMIEVWKKYYAEDIEAGVMVYLNSLYRLPSQDDVSRCRRHYQEEGLYLPTKMEIAKQRGMNIEKWRIALGYAPAFKQDLF